METRFQPNLLLLKQCIRKYLARLQVWFFNYNYCYQLENMNSQERSAMIKANKYSKPQRPRVRYSITAGHLGSHWELIGA